MTKRSSLLLLIVVGVLIGSNNDKALSTGYTPQSEEDFYREIGYETIDAAISDFENHYSHQLQLPLRVPPIAFTHSLGRFNDLSGEVNDSFEAEYINEKFPDNHYKINVRPVKHKIEFKEEKIIKVIKLENGKEAMFIDLEGFHVLVFERDNWQYMLSINKKVASVMLPGTLVKIANSIDGKNKN
ncbi:hypothetical protein [Bacillus sp. AK031]